MSKTKPFNRDKAKSILENFVVESVKNYFNEENEKAFQKNKSKLKGNEDDFQIEPFVKMFEIVNGKLMTLSQEIDNSSKFNVVKKQIYKKIINQFQAASSEFKSNKSLPVKLNNTLINELKKSEQEISNILSQINKLKGTLCFGGSTRKGIENNFNELRCLGYFWSNLLNCEAQQGVEEIYYGPVFNEPEFRNNLKNLIDKNFPHEQTPQIIKEEKIQYQYIEKPVSYMDNVRLAHELLYGLGRPQEISQAITYYYEEAERNHNIFACNALGQIYFEGIFVPKDINKSYSFYSKSANQDDSEALYRLGMLHEQGFISESSNEEKYLNSPTKKIKIAKGFYEKSANNGHLDAITDLGYIYQIGIKDPLNPNEYLEKPNLEEAIYYYKMAKKKRFPRALNNLGRLYLENPVEEKVYGDNLRKGIKYLELASELGNIKALYNLGICYEVGKGVPQNSEKSRSLFKDASHKGDVNAKLFYAVYLLKNANNQDQDEDFVEASFIFQEIISKDPNMGEPYFYLGYLYENGFGVDKNLTFAINYYSKAAQLEHSQSLNKLGDFFHSGIGVNKKDLSKAFQFYESAANLNNADALINLGTLYETGCKEFSKDIQNACIYYDKAARLGDSRGFLNIAHIYETVHKDEQEALRNYEKAAEHGNEIAKNILAMKGKTYIPSMKKTLINPASNLSKILNNNSQMILEDNTQNSFNFNQSKINMTKPKNETLPLISSYISSGIPKQLIHKQMLFDHQNSQITSNIDIVDKSKYVHPDEYKKGVNANKIPDKKYEKQGSLKENLRQKEKFSNNN